MVALAYYLAFQLRFNNGPQGQYALLRDRTIWWVARRGPICRALAGLSAPLALSGQRDYEASYGDRAMTC